MALQYGFSSHNENRKKTVQYALIYPKNILNSSVYPVRIESRGYKYIPAYGLNENSTISFSTHSFSTSTGNDIAGGVVSYSFEFLSNDGNFSYFFIDELSLNTFKIPKVGALYNMFFLNKTYSFSKIMKTTNFSQFSMFCVSFTQKTGKLSNDSSELELSITY